MEIPLQYPATITVQLAIAAVVLPLAAFFFNFFIGGAKSKLSAWISFAAILGSFVLSAMVFARVWNQPHLQVHHTWFTIGTTVIQAGLLLNNLSVLMLLLVSAIALPVHIYSIHYMDGDARYKRYFTYLSFFCFAMLALVVMDNLLLLYAFWELVGFASYLLIGFWFTRDKAVQANKKAFIINRIGDVGLLLGVLLLFSHYHTFDIGKLFTDTSALANAHNAGNAWLTLPGVCFLCGAIAKSAQFPLHTWLPDAMEGPTSVSALIHAATMVAAGIFLLGRVYPVFTPALRDTMAIIGCFTALMAATIALTQNDLKRILAYSTISQLGYMMMAMGIGAYSSALFHLATHAFFKCLLFLCAGAIIHQMHHIRDRYQLETDHMNIGNMGGLRKLMPVTFITCVVASLALVGFPLTSGFLSKDGILIQAFEWSQGRGWVYNLIPVTAMLTSLLTVFYIARLIFKVFFGEPRFKHLHPEINFNPHDGSLFYLIPMGLLALCCFFPLFSWSPLAYQNSWLYNGFALHGDAQQLSVLHTLVPVIINILTLPVLYLAYAVYVQRKYAWVKGGGFFYRLSYNQWYIDSFYTKVVVKAVLALSALLYWFDRYVVDGFVMILSKTALFAGRLTALFDRYVIDGILSLLTSLVQQAGNFIRGFQTGRVQGYLLTMLLIILVFYVLKTFI